MGCQCQLLSASFCIARLIHLHVSRAVWYYVNTPGGLTLYLCFAREQVITFPHECGATFSQTYREKSHVVLHGPWHSLKPIFIFSLWFVKNCNELIYRVVALLSCMAKIHCFGPQGGRTQCVFFAWICIKGLKFKTCTKTLLFDLR